MRIDIRSSESPLSSSLPTHPGKNGDQTAFQLALEQALVLTPAPASSSAKPSLPLQAALSPLAWPPLPESLSTSNELLNEEVERLKERQESYEEDLRENSELMERVIDNWEEQSPDNPLEHNLETDTDNAAELQELQENISGELSDDIPEMGLDFDGNPSGETHHSSDSGSPEHKNKAPQPLPSEAPCLQERDMSYAEIQHLVDTVLQSSSRLPHKLQHLLGKILESLSQGERYPLNQHTLLDLESGEWQTLFELFPARFFQGLIRPLLQQAKQKSDMIQDGHALFEAILYQRGLSSEQFDLLEMLWNRLSPLPGMFVSWLRQPELPTLSLADLQHPLEILQQNQGLLPGAAGHIQSLALHYLHHPQTAVRLLEISRNCLHGLPLSEAQIQLLSDKLADFCFSHTLDQQMAPLLAKALQGQSLEQEEIIRILQGAPQKILSYLPYAQLTPALQEIITFIHTDPDHSEENILALFLENESQPHAES